MTHDAQCTTHDPRPTAIYIYIYIYLQIYIAVVFRIKNVMTGGRYLFTVTTIPFDECLLQGVC